MKTTIVTTTVLCRARDNPHRHTTPPRPLPPLSLLPPPPWSSVPPQQQQHPIHSHSYTTHAHHRALFLYNFLFYFSHFFFLCVRFLRRFGYIFFFICLFACRRRRCCYCCCCRWCCLFVQHSSWFLANACKSKFCSRTLVKSHSMILFIPFESNPLSIRGLKYVFSGDSKRNRLHRSDTHTEFVTAPVCIATTILFLERFLLIIFVFFSLFFCFFYSFISILTNCFQTETNIPLKFSLRPSIDCPDIQIFCRHCVNLLSITLLPLRCSFFSSFRYYYYNYFFFFFFFFQRWKSIKKRVRLFWLQKYD